MTRKSIMPRIRTTLLFSLLVFSMLCSCRYALSGSEPVKVTSYADKERIRIGERFWYIINVKAPPEMEVDLPDAVTQLGVFEVKGYKTEEAGQAAEKGLNRFYLLTTYETGEQAIPPVAVRYRDGKGDWKKAYSEVTSIYVDSIFLKATIGEDIRDIEPPVSLRWPCRFHTIAGLIIFVLFAFAVKLLLISKRKVLDRLRRGPAPVVRLHQELSKFMAALSEKDEISREDLARLAELLKAYLLARLGINTGALTTEEFLTKAKSAKGLSGKHADFIETFLKNCDLVEFANKGLEQEELKESLARLKVVLDEIRPLQSKRTD
ncbi:MAG: hypothetical protein HQ558_04150 [Candidatus Omnitrophica bacterium]|nr:hypothetical protein [Candidatus Omnitrophota bacterium]